MGRQAMRHAADALHALATIRAVLNASRTMHRSTVSRSARGFTLLEMLVVLVIIGLLVGLVGPRLFSKVDQSKVTTAQTQVKLLRGAVETLRLDIGRYPTAEEGLALLAKPPSDAALAARWRGPYLDDAVPLDPWAAPYQYSIPGADSQPFALFSLGADGKRGGEGDAKDIGVLPAQP
jgi:general secretion pathway protein G